MVTTRLPTSRSAYNPVRSVHGDLYAHALASAYRSGTRVYDPDYALAMDPEYWEKVQRDPVIKHAMAQRRHMVAGREFMIEPDCREPTERDYEASAIMWNLIEQICSFTAARFNLTGGIFTSEGWQFIKTERQRLPMAEHGLEWWIVPTALEPVDKRRIRTVPVYNDDAPKGSKITTHYELHDYETLQWTPLRQDTPLIHFVYDDEEGRFGHGRGLAEAIYYYHYAKGIVLREGLQGLEKWANGIVVGKTKSDMPSPTSNVDVAKGYLAKLTKMRSGGAIVVDTEDEVDVLFPSGDGSKQVFEWFNYLDRAITQLILGSVLPTGGGADVGSNARAEVEQDSTETLIAYDRTVLFETYTDQLIRRVWEWNEPQFRALGYGQCARPRMVAAPVENMNPVDAVAVAAQALQAGIPLVKSQVYKKIGYAEPGPTDEVIEPSSAPAVPGFPM